jgi:hypothetical protein
VIVGVTLGVLVFVGVTVGVVVVVGVGVGHTPNVANTYGPGGNPDK